MTVESSTVCWPITVRAGLAEKVAEYFGCLIAFDECSTCQRRAAELITLCSRQPIQEASADG